MGNPLFPVLGNDWRISSGVGSRVSPGGIGSTNHQGIDIAAPYGTGVIAPVSMRVISAGAMGGLGNGVIAQGDDGYQYKFGHLSSVAAQAGQMLNPGQLLGRVGSTGNSTGNHLHYAITNAAGKLATDKLNAVLQTGKDKLKSAGGKLLEAIPVIGKPLAGVTNALGITGDCNILCQIKNWIETTKIFQRTAIVILALILIGAAFYLFGTGKMTKLVNSAA